MRVSCFISALVAGMEEAEAVVEEEEEEEEEVAVAAAVEEVGEGMAM